MFIFIRTYVNSDYMLHKVACTTNNVVYLITCKNCSMQYVGMTTNGILTRLANHRSCIKIIKGKCSCRTSFVDSGHDISDCIAQITFHLNQDDEDTKDVLGPFRYPTLRLTVRSHEVSKPQDWWFTASHRFKMWQAYRQQSNFTGIGQFQTQISRLRDFTRSSDKTSYRILKQGAAG